MTAKSIGPCYAEGCERDAKKKGLCGLHYQRLKNRGDFGRDKADYSNVTCKAPDCDARARSERYCIHHYNAFYRTGSVDNVRVNVRNKGMVCSVDGCEESATKVGMCHSHYQMKWVYGRTEKLGFEWRALDSRRPDETKTEWIARQWKQQKERNPDMEIGRRLEAVYGITRADYAEMLVKQNNACYICEEPETSMHRRDGKERVKRLAVDHCHTTGKVRKLLCTRCNHTLGRVKEDVDILRAMINYIEIHPKDTP